MVGQVQVWRDQGQQSRESKSAPQLRSSQSDSMSEKPLLHLCYPTFQCVFCSEQGS